MYQIITLPFYPYQKGRKLHPGVSLQEMQIYTEAPSSQGQVLLILHTT